MRLNHLASVAALLAVGAAAVLLTGGSDRTRPRATSERARMETRPLSIRPAGHPATRAHSGHRTLHRRAPKRVQPHLVALRPGQAPRVRYTPAAPAPHPAPAPVRRKPASAHHAPARAPRKPAHVHPANRPSAPPAAAPEAEHGHGHGHEQQQPQPQPTVDGAATVGIGPIEVHGGGNPEDGVDVGGHGGGD